MIGSFMMLLLMLFTVLTSQPTIFSLSLSLSLSFCLTHTHTHLYTHRYMHIYTYTHNDHAQDEFIEHSIDTYKHILQTECKQLLNLILNCAASNNQRRSSQALKSHRRTRTRTRTKASPSSGSKGYTKKLFLHHPSHLYYSEAGRNKGRSSRATTLKRAQPDERMFRQTNWYVCMCVCVYVCMYVCV